MKFAALVAAAILGSAATAKAQVPQPGVGQRPFVAPYPFTANSLWAQLSQVTALKGAMNRAALEAIFGVKLKDRVFGPPGATWTGAAARAPADWYYDLTYWHSEQAPGEPAARVGGTFAFRWAQPSGGSYVARPDPPAGICISPSVIAKSLIAQGYVLKGSESLARDVPFSAPTDYEYANQDWHVRVTVNPDVDCLIELKTYKSTI